jgi:hypothetical protein
LKFYTIVDLFQVVEQYLADDIAAGRIIPLAQLQQQQQQQQQHLHQEQQHQQDQQPQHPVEHNQNNNIFCPEKIHQDQNILLQQQQQQQQLMSNFLEKPNPHLGQAEPFSLLPNFDLVGVEPNGLDLTVHSLVDSR